jgi:hypothetical protein
MTGSPDNPPPLLQGFVQRQGVDPLPVGPEGMVCSAKGCPATASYDLRWNNPKIHTPDRRKHWLACPEHRDSLSTFLSGRGFLRDVEELPAS